MTDSTNTLLQDMGPVYHETDLTRFIVEPFNAVSSLSMSVAALLVWLLLIRKNYKNYPFLAFVYAPLIFTGGIGSTFFHALRAYPFFLYLDIIPVFLVTIMLSLFYWYKIYSRWYFVATMVFVIVLVRFVPLKFFEGSAAINVSYLMSGILILIPLGIFMYKTHFKYARQILISIAALLLALLFRYTDDFDYLVLPMGTHWLWHVFTGIGAWYLGLYIYNTSSGLKTE